MKEHVLKSWPEFFDALTNGHKTFELRRNDRDFVVGDVLVLREWKPHAPRNIEGEYTGREARRLVTYVLHGAGVGCVEPLKGLAIGYCILGLRGISSNV